MKQEKTITIAKSLWVYINWNSLWNSQIIHIWKNITHYEMYITNILWQKNMRIYHLIKQLACHCKWCNLIRYATPHLFVDIYRGATRLSFFFVFPTTKQKKTMCIPSFSIEFWRYNEHKFVFTKTIRLFAFDFYEAIVNYLFIEISSS